jgi:hypothetical protein
MFYIVYKTINLVNNKFYIGKHRQNIDPHQFDGYYGSGSQIINAVKKYGKDNFIRETLFVFENETECLLKEEETVAPHLGKSYCYNMRSGGIGGFEHINNNPELRKQVSKIASESGKGIQRHIPTVEEREASRQRNSMMKELGIGAYSPEAKAKAVANRDNTIVSKKVSGSNNGAYGTRFYYNTVTKQKKRFSPTDIISEEWVSSVDYFESKKKTHWYNDRSKSYLLKIVDPKIELLGLIKGRI